MPMAAVKGTKASGMIGFDESVVELVANDADDQKRPRVGARRGQQIGRLRASPLACLSEWPIASPLGKYLRAKVWLITMTAAPR